MCERNGVPRRTTREICKALKRDEHLDFDTLQERLRPYRIDPTDLERLRGEFASLDTPAMNPFLVTKINLKKLKKIESSRYGNAGMRSRVGLVLLNKDGTTKVYLMHFRDLNQKDSRELITAIRDRSNGVKFLITRNELKALLQ